MAPFRLNESWSTGVSPAGARIAMLLCGKHRDRRQDAAFTGRLEAGRYVAAAILAASDCGSLPPVPCLPQSNRRRTCLPAQVGFVVTLSGDILCPSPLRDADARTFLSCNSMFLANRESAEIYLTARQGGNGYPPDVAANRPADAPVKEAKEAKEELPP